MLCGEKAVDHCREDFFKVLDNMEVLFGERFDQESLKIQQKVGSSLLTGDLDDSLDQYPELNRASLSVCGGSRGSQETACGGVGLVRSV